MGSYSSSEEKKHEYSMIDDEDDLHYGISNKRTLGRSGSFKEENGFNVEKADVPTFNFSNTFESTLHSTKQDDRPWLVPHTSQFDAYKDTKPPLKSAKKLFFDQSTPTALFKTSEREEFAMTDDDFRTNDFSPNDEGNAAPIHNNGSLGIKRRLIA